MRALLFLLLTSLSLKAAVGWTNVVSSWIQVPANSGAGPTITTAITMCAWAARQVDRDTTKAMLITRGQTQPSPSQQLYEIYVLTNHYRFCYSDAAGGFGQVWETSGTAPSTNVPAHIAVSYTYGAGSSLKFYINGVSVSGSWIHGSGNTAVTNNNNALQFGCDGFATPFMGIIDEVAIWSSALTQAEIQIIANSKLKGMPRLISPSTLVGYWPLDNYTLSYGDHRVRDLSARRLHGSFEGTVPNVALPESYLSYPPNE